MLWSFTRYTNEYGAFIGSSYEASVSALFSLSEYGITLETSNEALTIMEYVNGTVSGLSSGVGQCAWL
ncbi:MAG: hypothetical protein ACP5VR_04340 [Acidimicrobiales bacterium]